MADIDFLEAIRRESALLGEAAASVPLDTPVPTCPGWKVEDLVGHLASVQLLSHPVSKNTQRLSIMCKAGGEPCPQRPSNVPSSPA
jgi:hypothetical protein